MFTLMSEKYAEVRRAETLRAQLAGGISVDVDQKKDAVVLHVPGIGARISKRIVIPVANVPRSHAYLKKLILARQLETLQVRCAADVQNMSIIKSRYRELEDALFSMKLINPGNEPGLMRGPSANQRLLRTFRFLPTSGAEVKWLTSPPWYYGFVMPTWINLFYESVQPTRINVHIGNSETGQTVLPTILPVRDVQVISIAQKVPWSQAMAAAMESDDESLIYSLLDLLYESMGLKASIWWNGEPDPDAVTDVDNIPCALTMKCDSEIWRRCRNSASLSHVRIAVQGAGRIKIRRIQIVLNGESILDTDAVPDALFPRTIAFGQDVVLDKLIRNHRLLQAGLPVNTDVKKGVVAFAAQRIGQSWISDHGGNWQYDSTLRYWSATTRAWCSEFAAYVIGSVAPMTNDDGQRIEARSANDTFRKCTDFVNWFRRFRPSRWIAPTSSVLTGAHGQYFTPSTPYRRLGDVLQAGFYVTVKKNSHSTLFIDWAEEDRDKGPVVPVDFNPGGVNYFYAIGGNQGDVVNIKTYSVSDDPSSVPNIDWLTGSIDGFGDTSYRIRK